VDWEGGLALAMFNFYIPQAVMLWSGTAGPNIFRRHSLMPVGLEQNLGFQMLREVIQWFSFWRRFESTFYGTFSRPMSFQIILSFLISLVVRPFSCECTKHD
jgi:hypothetical protein